MQFTPLPGKPPVRFAGVDAVTLEIRHTTVYRGPNICARMPAILVEIDIGELGQNFDVP